MIEELNVQAYLRISPNGFGIYLFDIKKINYLYKQEIKFESWNDNINLNNLKEFLEKNVFKIEKLIGKFLKNICLIIDTKKNTFIWIGIKKKNYQEIIDKNFLENTLTDCKDLFNENHQDKKIMHIIINKYLINGIHHSTFKNNLKANELCLEVKFKYISSRFASEIYKILERYQIRITAYLDGNYIRNFYKDEQMELCEMVYKIQSGSNENEVKLVPKNKEKTGFFVKFFQLFS